MVQPRLTGAISQEVAPVTVLGHWLLGRKTFRFIKVDALSYHRNAASKLVGFKGRCGAYL